MQDLENGYGEYTDGAAAPGRRLVVTGSGRQSEIVAKRAAELGMDPELIVLGSRDKRADVEAVAERAGVPLEQVAAMGDDLPDLPMLDAVGLSCCPADAVGELLDRCTWVSTRPGGRGAVRELAEAVLKSQGRWQPVVDLFS